MWYALVAVISLGAGYILGQVVALLKSSSASLKLLKSSHVVCLYMYVKVLERLVTHNGLALKDYIGSGASARNIKIYKDNLKAEVDAFKEKSIQLLIDAHPPLFEASLEFSDWNSAMAYLNKSTDYVFNHITGDIDDKTIH